MKKGLGYFLKAVSAMLVIVSVISVSACGKKTKCHHVDEDDDLRCDLCEERFDDGEEVKDVYKVEMDVEGFGTIKMQLHRHLAPKTVDNFMKLAEENFYDGLTFIRAQEGFVIQGGSPTKDASGSLEQTIYGEFSDNGYTKNTISHKAGVISMARGNDPNSGSCQFFITLADARQSLDGSYAGFGYINEESMDIVHAIAEAMFEHGEPPMGFVEDISKQPVITDVRVVGGYNI